jgi:hypothetical protein
VAAIVKLEARNQLKNLKQGAFESIITYKKRYNDTLKAYHDHGNPPKDGAEQAMDFFDGLDNVLGLKFQNLKWSISNLKLSFVCQRGHTWRYTTL